MTYIDPPLTTDSRALSTDILDRLMTSIPGWVPQEGHIEVWMIEVMANALAEVLGVASRIPRKAFRYFGKSLVGLLPIDGSVASAPTTWTMTDTLGHTIPAGTTVAYRTAAGVLVPFVTAAPVVVPAGSNTTGAGAVVVYSVDIGTDKNGLAAGALTLVDSLAFVASVTATAVTAGATDAESDDAYLDRLVAELTLMAPRPVVARDFAVYSRKVAGVARAVALDGYNPADDTFNNQRMVTVAAVDSAGANVSAGTKTAIQTLLDSVREANFIVNVVDPTRTVVNVNFTAVAQSGYSAALVQAAAIQAITDYLNPASWGSISADPSLWTQHGTVRYLSIAGIIEAVPGVDYLTALTVNGGVVDVVLGGRISLPTVGAITGTVT